MLGGCVPVSSGSLGGNYVFEFLKIEISGWPLGVDFIFCGYISESLVCWVYIWVSNND